MIQSPSHSEREQAEVSHAKPLSPKLQPFPGFLNKRLLFDFESGLILAGRFIMENLFDD